ncbi:MAG: DUF6515 family protein [Pseudomonadota bacterium]
MKSNSITARNLCAPPVSLRVLALLVAAALAAVSVSHAEEHARESKRSGMRFDNRYSHNQYYHDRGYSVRGIPRGAYEINHGGQHYWFGGGQWYRSRGGLSIVIGAPIGAFVPVLPPLYSTVWWSGRPYYYADDTYYTWDGDVNKYEVVQAPAGIDQGGSTAAASTDSVFVYPKNGQTPEELARDRFDCHQFALQQTGFDPTASGGGVPASELATRKADYLRAQAACLDGRGYSVR